MRLRFVDRLHERGWVDRYAFLSFCFFGIILIPLTKYLGVPAGWVALGAVLVMILFAGIQDRRGTGRLRSDQAGDNCYYLGLVYTLASLAYAIAVFDPSNTDSIVHGFGIALATTIVGLVLRVFFNQSRADLSEVEDTTRIELADAAGRLRAELNQVTVSMSDLARGLRQSLEEMRTAAVDNVAETSKTAVESIRAVSAQATEQLSTHDTELRGGLQRLTKASAKAIESFEAQAAHVETLREGSAALASSAVSIQLAADGTQSTLQSISGGLENIAGLQQGATSIASSVESAVTTLNQSVEALAARMTEYEESTSKRLDQLRDAPVNGVAEAAEHLRSVIARVSDDLGGVVARQHEASDQLVDDLARARETAQTHNQALESELAKSRENVAKVHSALVEMTSDLIKRAE